MYKSFYAGSALTALPILALALFLVFFLLVLVWVLAVKRSSDFDAVAALPLHDLPDPRKKK